MCIFTYLNLYFYCKQVNILPMKRGLIKWIYCFILFVVLINQLKSITEIREKYFVGFLFFNQIVALNLIRLDGASFHWILFNFWQFFFGNIQVHWSQIDFMGIYSFGECFLGRMIWKLDWLRFCAINWSLCRRV